VNVPGSTGRPTRPASQPPKNAPRMPTTMSQIRPMPLPLSTLLATNPAMDIVKGSSPREIHVNLPAGSFGRPALTVTEPWSVKGVGFQFLQAVSLQNLLIFSVVLIAATILVTQTAYVSVRRRRSELAVLRAVGWPPWRIALLIELEMLILGLAVGAVGLVVGIVIAALAHVGASWWTVVGVVPLALLIALLAGLVPAISTMRGTAKEIVREVVCQTHGGRGRSRLASSWSGVASLPHAGAHSASFIAVAGPLRSESTQSTFGFRLPSATESMWSRYASPAPLGKRNLTKSVAIPTSTPEAVNEFDPCIGTRDDKPRLPLQVRFGEGHTSLFELFDVEKSRRDASERV
jgi:hypothetical protein